MAYRQEPEIKKKDKKEVELETGHPGQAEFSLQKDTFVPGENNYFNEQPGTHSDFDDSEGNRVEYSEELDDGGERDEFAPKKSDESCGGL
ncbi:hypothetical protein [Thalassobacillus devorans]|uniref:hypothetical protein n=1 Tax=Thalassobacillus devorans TaxID=279813 RepID=UPI00048FC4C4|nr:hypothetical protein [Thalassobacillus devorans]